MLRIAKEGGNGAEAHCWKCCFQLARSMEDSDSSMRLDDMMPRMRTSMSKLPRSSCAHASRPVEARAQRGGWWASLYCHRGGP